MSCSSKYRRVGGDLSGQTGVPPEFGNIDPGGLPQPYHEPCSIVKDTVRIDFDELGEGWGGEFDEEDPGDEELLRFTTYRWQDGSWEEVDSGSYCTQLPVTLPPGQRKAALQYLMGQLHGAVTTGDSVRHRAAQLSWFAPDWFTADGQVKEPE